MYVCMYAHVCACVYVCIHACKSRVDTEQFVGRRALIARASAARASADIKSLGTKRAGKGVCVICTYK